MKVLEEKGAGQKYEGLAIKALENDIQRADKAKAVENLYKRLIKAGSTGEAFKAKAKEYFPYSTTF